MWLICRNSDFSSRYHILAFLPQMHLKLQLQLIFLLKAHLPLLAILLDLFQTPPHAPYLLIVSLPQSISTSATLLSSFSSWSSTISHPLIVSLSPHHSLSAPSTVYSCSCAAPPTPCYHPCPDFSSWSSTISHPLIVSLTPTIAFLRQPSITSTMPSWLLKKVHHHSTQRCATIVIQLLILKDSCILVPKHTNLQGGRSCAGAQGAPAEKFGLGRKF